MKMLYSNILPLVKHRKKGKKKKKASEIQRFKKPSIKWF